MATAGDIRGVLTTLNHQLPAGLDGTRIAQWRMREGRSYEEVRTQIANGFDDYNEEMLSAWGDMVTVTDLDYFEYPNGGTLIDMKQLSSGSRSDTVKGFTMGHMIDLLPYGQAIGGDWRYFRDTREAVVLATVRAIVQAGRNLFDKALLTRFMTTTENKLGSSGYDVPFCNANPNSGSGGPVYVPPQWNGKVFDETHTHYLGYNSSGGKTFDDVFAGLAQTINEHGHDGPYIAYVSEADTTTIRALTNYVKPVNNIQIIDRGGATSGNQYFENGLILAAPAVGGRYIGAYDTGYGPVGLKATNRLPTGYVALYKSYGTMDPRNPIGVRIHPDFGFGFRLMEIPSWETTWPVKEIDIEVEYGISCGVNRTLGAAGYLVAGGVWANPTIN